MQLFVLPSDIYIEILSRVDETTLINCSSVCKLFRQYFLDYYDKCNINIDYPGTVALFKDNRRVHIIKLFQVYPGIALRSACEAGDIMIANKIFKKIKPCRMIFEFALRGACSGGNVDIVKMILDEIKDFL